MSTQPNLAALDSRSWEAGVELVGVDCLARSHLASHLVILRRAEAKEGRKLASQAQLNKRRVLFSVD